MSEQTVTGHTFNEAPASWNVKYVSADGFECQFTLRDETGAALMPKIDAVMKWLAGQNAHATRNGNAPAAPAALSQPGPSAPAQGTPPAAAAAPASGQPPAQAEETIDVQTVSHALTEQGKPFMKVKGGKFSKFGAKAWPEIVPADAANFTEWPVGQEYQPPASMKRAVVTGSKVVRFIA